MSQIAKALQRSGYLKDLAEGIYEYRKAQKFQDLINSLGISDNNPPDENKLVNIAYTLAGLSPNVAPSDTDIPIANQPNLQSQSSALKKLANTFSQSPIQNTAERNALKPIEKQTPETLSIPQSQQIPLEKQKTRGTKLEQLVSPKTKTEPVIEQKQQKSPETPSDSTTSFKYVEPTEFFNNIYNNYDAQVLPLLQSSEKKKADILNKINLLQNAKTKLQTLSKFYNSYELENLANQYDSVIKSLTDKYNSIGTKIINVSGGTVFYDQDSGTHVFVPKFEETYYTDPYEGKKYKVVIDPYRGIKTKIEIGVENLPETEKNKLAQTKELEKLLDEYNKKFEDLQKKANDISTNANSYIESLKSSGVEIKYGYGSFNDLSGGLKIGAKFGDRFYYPNDNIELLNRIFGSPQNIETGSIQTNILKATVEQPKTLAWSYIDYFDKLSKIDKKYADVSQDLKDYFDYAIRIANILFQVPKLRTSQDPQEQAIYKAIFPKGEKEESVNLVPIAEKMLDNINSKYLQKYGDSDFIKNFQTLMRNYVLGRLFTLQTDRAIITK